MKSPSDPLLVYPITPTATAISAPAITIGTGWRGDGHGHLDGGDLWVAMSRSWWTVAHPIEHGSLWRSGRAFTLIDSGGREPYACSYYAAQGTFGASNATGFWW